MNHWMTQLASHYESVRSRYPDDRLLILFDIDGTILDMRHMIYDLLTRYDAEKRTALFDTLTVADIAVHEDDVASLLDERGVSNGERDSILKWFDVAQWSPDVLLESHRPFAGVMEVMRWFQIQPRTYVGLNTGRPESMRMETLRSLNRLGEEYKVSFTSGSVCLAWVEV
ncbi:MAG: hypothetical protein FJ317_00405 [SAR202 cluster bacterium]|nr:hypothetical protein [SAR202 cluster bacterium]